MQRAIVVFRVIYSFDREYIASAVSIGSIIVTGGYYIALIRFDSRVNKCGNKETGDKWQR